VDVFLNELSFCGQATNKDQGSGFMSDVQKVLKIVTTQPPYRIKK